MMKENLRNFVCNGGAYAENHCNIWKKYANSFDRKKQNLIWMNRMIESRLAVAQQLTETATIMETVANDLYDISAAEPEFQEELQKESAKKHVILKAAWVMDKVEGRRQSFSYSACQERTVCFCNRGRTDALRVMRK